MSDRYTLVITTNPAARTADFRLQDTHGRQIGYHQADFSKISTSHQHGLFDLRTYLRLYVEAGQEAAAIGEIGVCIAEEVLGEEIFTQLWRRQDPRSLDIQLPPFQEDDHLAAALSRIPWEIARPRPDQPSLSERNLRIRLTPAAPPAASACLSLGEKDEVRILFVFAEARGSRPLGARKERRELLGLFQRRIHPQRRVVAHFLTHGVTRERLEDQIRRHGGYHVVHWSGHGHMNLLELCKPDGSPDHLSGEGLLQLFINAGGYLPRLCFLSACHSGEIRQVRNWQDFGAAASGDPSSTREVVEKDAAPDLKALDLEIQPGYTGTAQALLHGGVRSVVAMRYAVGDDYARELAVEFYDALFAHAQPKPVNTALAMAEAAMLDSRRHDQTRFSACDHATPVLYGEEDPGLVPPQGRSSAATPDNPRLHRIDELTTASHEHFVGRTWQLAELGAGFIGASEGGEVRPVAVISGLGGLGKTALTAEALDLWQDRFKWVLLYQAKPDALSVEAVLLDIHLRLMGELGLYHDHVKDKPGDAIHREPMEGFTGQGRTGRLIRNLIRAMNAEPILLVLDNFETNLRPHAESGLPGGTAAWACQDPVWDECLAALAEGLAGGPSRVMLTCRRPLAALPPETVCSILLGPLPAAEAALFLSEHPVLGWMFFSGGEEERDLAIRLLEASRFHPLLMDRLVRLAAEPALRPQLLHALATLEGTGDFSTLPGLFTADPRDVRGLAYLEDALAVSIGQLIGRASAPARLLLHVIALADGPVPMKLAERVWSGESHADEQLRIAHGVFMDFDSLPPEGQQEYHNLSPELRSRIESFVPNPAVREDAAPMLRYLLDTGLVTREGEREEAPLSCHELVKEGIRKWMETHPADQQEMTAQSICRGYADRWLIVHSRLIEEDKSAAFRAGFRAFTCYALAGDYENLGSLASRLANRTNDSDLLKSLIPPLRTAVEAAPEGPGRWRCRISLADAYRNSGQAQESLPLYQQAASEVRTAVERNDEGSASAAEDLDAIYNNWSHVLTVTGDLKGAIELQGESAKASKSATVPLMTIIGRELELSRLLIRQGQAETEVPKVEKTLRRLWGWLQGRASGNCELSDHDMEGIDQVVIGALDILKNHYLLEENWEAALTFVDASLELETTSGCPAEDIAITRMNRAAILMEFPDRRQEARSELECCLELFRNNLPRRSLVFASLAELAGKSGEMLQAVALQKRSLELGTGSSDPLQRANSHANLAFYMRHSGDPALEHETDLHHLASLAYHAVLGDSREGLQILQNYGISFYQMHKAGRIPEVPRVAELLKNPDFASLRKWLEQRGVEVEELQAGVDGNLAQVWQVVLAAASQESDD